MFETKSLQTRHATEGLGPGCCPSIFLYGHAARNSVNNAIAQKSANLADR